MKTLNVTFNKGEKELICVAFNKYANGTPMNYCFEEIVKNVTKETVLKGLKIYLEVTKSFETSKKIRRTILKIA
jgi:hypothetical protein